MGLAMAQNVQQFLHREKKPGLRFWNRTASRGAPLESIGAVGCHTIAQLVQQCDLVFISVSRPLLKRNHPVVYSVLGRTLLTDSAQKDQRRCGASFYHRPDLSCGRYRRQGIRGYNYSSSKYFQNNKRETNTAEFILRRRSVTIIVL